MSKLDSLKPSIARTLDSLLSITSDTEREALRDETISRLGKVQTPTIANFLGEDFVCGVTWLSKDDYTAAELRSLQRLIKSLGSSRFYSLQGGSFLGFAVPTYGENQSDISLKPSFLAYINAIKENIFLDGAGIAPPHIALVSSDSLEVDLRTYTMTGAFYERKGSTLLKNDGISRSGLELGKTFTTVTLSNSFDDQLKSKVGDQLFYSFSEGENTYFSPREVKRDYDFDDVKRILGRNFKLDNRINTVIYLDSTGNRLVCGFFSDGTPVPSLDGFYDSSIDIFALVNILSESLRHLTEFIDSPSNWTQFFYIVDEQSEALKPQTKPQKRAIDIITNAKRRKLMQIGLIAGAVLLGAGIYGYHWYSEWSSVDAQRARARAFAEEQARLEKEAEDRTNTLKGYAEAFIQRSAYSYSPSQALRTILNNILPIPTRISEGKLDDGWRLRDWNCVAGEGYDRQLDGGLTYNCLINYAGERLAQVDLLQEWATSSKALSHLTLRDVVRAGGIDGKTQSGIFELSFTLSPQRLSSDVIVGDEEMQRSLSLVAQKASFSGINFSVANLTTMTSTPEESEGIDALREENPTRTAPIYFYPFSLSANIGVIGASGFQLPPNTTLNRVGGSGTNITIEGIIKYADQL